MSLTIAVIYKTATHSITLDKTQTVGKLKSQIKKLTNIPTIQQQVSFKVGEEKKVLSDNECPLSLAGIEGKELNVKNLGKQISWRNVFFVEYAGPLLIFPILYLIGKRSHTYNSTQMIALALAILHFLKRQLQTAFVHVFSHETMPFKRVFINSLHYWILFALMVGVELFLFPNDIEYSVPVRVAIVVAWTGCQFANFMCHRVLASFRKNPKQKKEGEYVNAAKVRQIPYGWGFDLVSCANYFWEALTWILFALLTRCWTSYLFAGVSIAQMLSWAIKKHKNYKKEFGDRYPKGRKAMFPFLI